jgi:hypothetical protein
MSARRMNPRIAVSVVFVVAMFMTVMDKTFPGAKTVDES